MKWKVLIALLVAAALLSGTPALGQMGGWFSPFGGPWGSAMGGMGGMMGGGGGMGGGHCPMMGGYGSYGQANPYAQPRKTPVTATEARTLAERYIEAAGLDLTVTAVKERRTVFEVETAETDGTPGISVFVSKTTGAVWPEMGPQMMGGL